MAIFTGSSSVVASRTNARMQRSLKQFTKELRAFAKTRVPGEVKLITQRLGVEALSRVVLKTPVATGRAQGNWQVSIGGSNEQEIPKDPNPVATGTATIQQAQPFESIHIFNNVHYVIWLENGSSKQAPQGMVAVTIEELRAVFP